jgi:hypothetical protein
VAQQQREEDGAEAGSQERGEEVTEVEANTMSSPCGPRLVSVGLIYLATRGPRLATHLGAIRVLHKGRVHVEAQWHGKGWYRAAVLRKRGVRKPRAAEHNTEGGAGRRTAFIVIAAKPFGFSVWSAGPRPGGLTLRLRGSWGTEVRGGWWAASRYPMSLP